MSERFQSLQRRVVLTRNKPCPRFAGNGGPFRIPPLLARFGVVTSQSGSSQVAEGLLDQLERQERGQRGERLRANILSSTSHQHRSFIDGSPGSSQFGERFGRSIGGIEQDQRPNRVLPLPARKIQTTLRDRRSLLVLLGATVRGETLQPLQIGR